MLSIFRTFAAFCARAVRPVNYEGQVPPVDDELEVAELGQMPPARQSSKGTILKFFRKTSTSSKMAAPSGQSVPAEFCHRHNAAERKLAKKQARYQAHKAKQIKEMCKEFRKQLDAAATMLDQVQANKNGDVTKQEAQTQILVLLAGNNDLLIKAKTSGLMAGSSGCQRLPSPESLIGSSSSSFNGWTIQAITGVTAGLPLEDEVDELPVKWGKVGTAAQKATDIRNLNARYFRLKNGCSSSGSSISRASFLNGAFRTGNSPQSSLRLVLSSTTNTEDYTNPPAVHIQRQTSAHDWRTLNCDQSSKF